MKTLRSALFAVSGALALSTLSACSTMPVDPCSREGVEYRINGMLKEFVRENKADLRDIKQASEFLGGETAFGAMRLAFALDSLKRLVDNFRDDVIPELQSMTRECGTTENVREVFIDMLRDEGVDRKVLDWVDAMSSLFETEVQSEPQT